MIRKTLVEIILLVSLTFLTYYNGLPGGFHFDDHVLLLKESFVVERPTLSQVLNYDMGRPVTLLSFRLNYLLGKEEPFSYHLFNVFNHCLNVVLVYFFLYLTFRRVMSSEERFSRFLPFIGSLLFAVHPLHTEAVNYIWARASLLATSFFLLAINAYIMGADSKNRKFLFFALSVVFYILGVGSKPIAITLPAILLIYDLFFIAHFDWKRMRGRLILYPIYSLIALLIVIKILLIFGERQYGIGFKVEGIPTLTFFYTQLNVIVKYITLLIYPVNLNLEYDYPLATSLFSFPTFLSFLLHAGLMIYALLICKDKPLIAFSIFWFYIALSPSSSFVPVVDVIFEHHTYLPSIGFFLAATLLFGYMARGKEMGLSNSGIDGFVAIVLIFLVSLAICATIKRNQIWKDDVALWEDVVKKSPNKPRPHNNLGHALFSKGSIARAREEFEKAIKIDPNYVDAILNLSVCYLYLREYDKAAALIERNLSLKPDDHVGYYNLGLLHQEKKVYDKAIAAYQTAVKLDPKLKEGHINLGICYLATGLVDNALDRFNKALQLDPGNAIALYDMAVAYARKGDAGKAVEYFKQAIKVKPDFYEAENDLGVFLLENGLVDKAVAELQKAVQINPSRSQAYINLGLCFAQLGSYDDAINTYQNGIKIDPLSAGLHFNLGDVYALKGELKKAQAEFSEALKINPEHARARVGLEEVGKKLKDVAEVTK